MIRDNRGKVESGRSRLNYLVAVQKNRIELFPLFSLELRWSENTDISLYLPIIANGHFLQTIVQHFRDSPLSKNVNVIGRKLYVSNGP